MRRGTKRSRKEIFTDRAIREAISPGVIREKELSAGGG